MSNNKYTHKWSECNPIGKPHFVHNLCKLYAFALQKTDRRPHSVFQFFVKHMGNIATDAPYDDMLDLVNFARNEYNSYRFSPISFSLIRFEKAFSQKTHILDLWLSCCCSTNMAEVIDDLAEEN